MNKLIILIFLFISCARGDVIEPDVKTEYCNGFTYTVIIDDRSSCDKDWFCGLNLNEANIYRWNGTELLQYEFYNKRYEK